MARFNPGNGAIRLDLKTFRDLEDQVHQMDVNSKEFRQGLNTLIHMVARTHEGYARKMTAGPTDTYQDNPALAWAIPVRRITGQYHKAWKTRKVAYAAYKVLNDSRAAYYVEYGLHPFSLQRRPRPIIRKSAIATLKMIQTTRTVEQFGKNTIGRRRDQKGKFRSFESRLGPNLRSAL